VSKAREKAIQKAIRTCFAAADALSATFDHMRVEREDDQRRLMAAQLREWASYMEQATWWRSDSE
jgi:hypothetical protein